MKKSVLRGFAAALVVVAAGGCGKQEPEQAQEVWPDAHASGARPAEAATSSASGRTLTVCEVATGHSPAPPHAPPMGGKFEIMENVSNPSLYALKLDEPPKWAPGWQALMLFQVGTQPARIPHANWTAKCKPGDNSEPKPFAPTTDTKRYRGATCLPDGTLQLAQRTCSNGQEYFHEIVIYVHEPKAANDIQHMMLQYCGKNELDSDQLMCPQPTAASAARMPHPGHVHIDP
jgi:hypothetical protein